VWCVVCCVCVFFFKKKSIGYVITLEVPIYCLFTVSKDVYIIHCRTYIYLKSIFRYIFLYIYIYIYIFREM